MSAEPGSRPVEDVAEVFRSRHKASRAIGIVVSPIAGATVRVHHPGMRATE